MVIKTVTMFFLFLLTVVCARNVDNINLRDHYLDQPKLDFGPQYGASDGSNPEVQQNRREINVRNENLNGFNDHRRLDTELNRRGNQNGNVHRSYELFGSSAQEFHGSINNNRDGESHFNKNRRTHEVGNLGHNFESEFDRHTNIQRGNHRTDNRFHQTNSQDPSQFGSPAYTVQKSHGYEINDHGNYDNTFYPNSGSNLEVHNVDRIKLRVNIKANNQGGRNNHRDTNKNQFETVSTEERKTIDNQYDNKRTSLSNEDRREANGNIPNDLNNKSDISQENQNTTTSAQKETTSDDISKDSGNIEDKRPQWKTTTDNEVINKKDKDINKKGLEQDKWIWSASEETTTVTPDSLDNRNAFNGDKCPTGKVKIGTICVDPD